MKNSMKEKFSKAGKNAAIKLSKYYTPKLEEFHIGFQYEWLDEDKIWHKEDTPKEITIEGYEEQTYGLRVKYLDREDIESLGFRCIHEEKKGV